MGEVRPIPTLGGVVRDARGHGRALRVSWHREDGIVVLSLWDGPRCTGTVRVAARDVPTLVEALQVGLPPPLVEPPAEPIAPPPVGAAPAPVAAAPPYRPPPVEAAPPYRPPPVEAAPPYGPAPVEAALPYEPPPGAVPPAAPRPGAVPPAAPRPRRSGEHGQHPHPGRDIHGDGPEDGVAG